MATFWGIFNLEWIMGNIASTEKQWVSYVHFLKLVTAKKQIYNYQHQVNHISFCIGFISFVSNLLSWEQKVVLAVPCIYLRA